MKRTFAFVLVTLILVACGSAGQQAAPPQAPVTTTAPAATDTQKVRIGLDWTPNTNHTGLYVAQAKGYYAAKGLEAEILQAQEGGTVEQLVATGRLDFGISYQEAVTQARAEGVPIVSVAAVIQHNTSGFASRASENIRSPKDFEGKAYGGWGSPMEEAVLRGLMECAGGDFSKISFVDIGSSDFFVATERGDVDFAWIFQGWTGIEAQQRGIELNMVMINDLKCVPDYYTPVLITSEKLIAEQPELVRSFVQATSQGYQLAINAPDEAAQTLLDAAPELDPGLVTSSQQYLAQQYQADAPRWGEQKAEVWQAYANWMAERKLIPATIEPEKAFTNQFLP